MHFIFGMNSKDVPVIIAMCFIGLVLFAVLLPYIINIIKLIPGLIVIYIVVLLGEKIFDCTGKVGLIIYLIVLLSPMIIGLFYTGGKGGGEASDDSDDGTMLAFLAGWLLGGWGHHDR